LLERRLDDEHIWQVHAAVEGVVHDEDVAVVHLIAIAVEQGANGRGHRPEVERDCHRLGHRLTCRAE
jgi:hypothetical protein